MSSFPDFRTFFRALWGHDPFPWQQRLASEVADGGWPEWLTLPTGTGKTAALDVAIYDLARQADRPMAARTAPVRIVFAVNRRIVVDEAYERTKHIAGQLKLALADAGNVLHPVALALSKLSGIDGGLPLETYPLRGATFTDHAWARTPTQPLVITTTLDQLGSRLLFRGYGVSPNARPIHAALLANDALLILDEAHTAKAFSQTLAALSVMRKEAKEPIQLPFAAVQLTATPPASVGETFSLGDDDRAHPIIRARLNASKPAELMDVEGAKGAARHKKLADAISGTAISCLANGHRRILIVVNRVATAEALFATLDVPKTQKGHGAAVKLLTGRMRPLDRQELIGELTTLYQLKSSAPAADVPCLILIATQCIEVGADYDFDALLTELAPLDSLRQRFGRLNRQGRDIPAPAAIFAPDEALDVTKEDPLYGTSLSHVWSWLKENRDADERVDFGLQSMSRIMPTGETLDAMLAPAPDAPILLGPHLDLFCQTSPEPHVCPDPSLYIHGPGRSFPEVAVVLRADLVGTTRPEELLKTVPPIGTEAATLPLYLACHWLENPDKKSDDGGDAPEVSPKFGAGRGAIALENAFRWRDGEASRLSKVEELAPGDILVLPAQTDPEKLCRLFPTPPADAWSLDQFESAHLLSRDRLAIRFHSGIRAELQRLLPEGDARERFNAIVAPLFARDEEEERWCFCEADWRNAMPDLALHLAANLPATHPWQQVWSRAAWLGNEKPRAKDDWKVISYPGQTLDGVIFFNRSRVGATPWPFDPADLGQQGPQAIDAISLAVHSLAVEGRAASNSRGLPEPLAETVRDAGAWHDLGKLDPRFQALLHGCSLWAVAAKEPLAKSGPRTLALQQFLSSQAELPTGFRHELLSALIVELSAAGREHPEHDLLLHLIASHHGRCRAMAPVVPDPRPEPFDVEVAGEMVRFCGQDCPLAHLSQGVARRFWSLNRRFGWWGLPYLETLLRLADQSESANPNSNPSTPS
ncbi:type I-U CRISPR-associated helicase/endonuclease Cas3 [bacterium]|nr:type I-U CRISPR-associated helicase/endonuclease Cas3 [bacterium]